MRWKELFSQGIVERPTQLENDFNVLLSHKRNYDMSKAGCGKRILFLHLKSKIEMISSDRKRLQRWKNHCNQGISVIFQTLLK